MANPEHLEILRKGVEVWNKWREENREIKVDLSRADLSGIYFKEANLRGADLRGADFRSANLNRANFFRANLNRANLSKAELREAELGEANISEANLSGTFLSEADISAANISATDISAAFLRGAKLRGANLSEANLSQAKLSGANFFRANLNRADLNRADLNRADISRANFSEANLRGANLQWTQALGTNLENTTLTGACIQDWNINSETNLKNTKCDYIFLKSSVNKEKRKDVFCERRPHQGDKSFEAGDFETLVKKSQETIDLIFRNGIDWQAFLNSYEQLKVEAGSNCFPIEAIENKGDGAFIVRIQAPPELDKGKIQKSFETKYKKALKIKEKQYRDKLNAKDREIAIYREQNANLNNLAIILANQPTIFNNMNSNDPRNETHNNTFNAPVGGHANVMRDNSKIESKQYNYAPEQKQSLAEAATEIQQLLDQLSQDYSTEEAEQKVAEDLANKAKQDPSFKERLRNWSLSLAGKGAETAVVESIKEGVKRVIPMAITLLV